MSTESNFEKAEEDVKESQAEAMRGIDDFNKQREERKKGGKKNKLPIRGIGQVEQNTPPSQTKEQDPYEIATEKELPKFRENLEKEWQALSKGKNSNELRDFIDLTHKEMVKTLEGQVSKRGHEEGIKYFEKRYDIADEYAKKAEEERNAINRQIEAKVGGDIKNIEEVLREYGGVIFYSYERKDEVEILDAANARNAIKKTLEAFHALDEEQAKTHLENGESSSLFHLLPEEGGIKAAVFKALKEEYQQKLVSEKPPKENEEFEVFTSEVEAKKALIENPSFINNQQLFEIFKYLYDESKKNEEEKDEELKKKKAKVLADLDAVAYLKKSSIEAQIADDLKKIDGDALRIGEMLSKYGGIVSVLSIYNRQKNVPYFFKSELQLRYINHAISAYQDIKSTPEEIKKFNDDDKNGELFTGIVLSVGIRDIVKEYCEKILEQKDEEAAKQKEEKDDIEIKSDKELKRQFAERHIKIEEADLKELLRLLPERKVFAEGLRQEMPALKTAAAQEYGKKLISRHNAELTYIEERIFRLENPLNQEEETVKYWQSLGREFSGNIEYSKNQIKKIISLSEIDREIKDIEEKTEEWKERMETYKKNSSIYADIEKVIAGHLSDLEEVKKLLLLRQSEIKKLLADIAALKKEEPAYVTPSKKEKNKKLQENGTEDEKKQRMEKESDQIEKNIEEKIADLGASEFLTHDGKIQFEALSDGQKLQLLDQFQQKMYVHIQDEAKEAHKKNVQDGKKVKVIGRLISTSRNIFKENRIKSQEKKIGKNLLDGKSENDRKVKADMLAGLMESIKKTEEIYGLKVNVDGKNLDRYKIDFISDEEKGNGEIDYKLLQKFNSAATDFSRLPTEADMNAAGITRAQRKDYQEKKQAYADAQKELISELRDTKTKEYAELISKIENRNDLNGSEKKLQIENILTRSTLLEGNAIDARVKMSQYMNLHPDAAKQIEMLRDDSSAWEKVKGAFSGGKNSRDIVAYGAIGIGSASLRGTAKALKIIGWNPVTSGIVGAVAGGFRGWFRGEKNLREREQMMRKGKEVENIRSKDIHADVLNGKGGLAMSAREIGKSLTSVGYADKAFIDAKKGKYDQKINELSDLVQISFDDYKKNPDNLKIAEVFVKNENARQRSAFNAEKDRLALAFKTGAMTKDESRNGMREALDVFRSQELTGVDEKALERMKLGWTEKLETRLEFMRTKINNGLVNFGEGKERDVNELAMLQAIAKAQVSLASEFSTDSYIAAGSEYMMRTKNPQREARLEEKFQERNDRVARRQTLYKAGQAGIGAVLGGAAGELGYQVQPWLGRHIHSMFEGAWNGMGKGISTLESMFGKTATATILGHAKEEALHTQTAQIIAEHHPLNNSSLDTMEQEDLYRMPKVGSGSVSIKIDHNIANPTSVNASNLRDFNTKYVYGGNDPYALGKEKLPDVSFNNTGISHNEVIAPADQIIVPPHVEAPVPAVAPEHFETLIAHSQKDSRELLLKHYLQEKYHLPSTEAGKKAHEIIGNTFDDGKEPPFHKGDAFRIVDDGNPQHLGQIHVEGPSELTNLPFDEAPKIPQSFPSALLNHRVIDGKNITLDDSAQLSVKRIIRENAAKYGFTGDSKNPAELTTWVNAAERQIVNDHPWIKTIVTHDGNIATVARVHDGTWSVSVEKGTGLTPHLPKHLRALHGDYQNDDIAKVLQDHSQPAVPNVAEHVQTPPQPDVTYQFSSPDFVADPKIPTQMNVLLDACKITPRAGQNSEDIFHVLKDIAQYPNKDNTLLSNVWNDDQKRARLYIGFIQHMTQGGKTESSEFLKSMNIQDPFNIPAGTTVHGLDQILNGNIDGFPQDPHMESMGELFARANDLQHTELDGGDFSDVTSRLGINDNYDFFIDTIKKIMKEGKKKFDMDTVNSAFLQMRGKIK